MSIEILDPGLINIEDIFEKICGNQIIYISRLFNRLFKVHAGKLIQSAGFKVCRNLLRLVIGLELDEYKERKKTPPTAMKNMNSNKAS